MVTNDDDVVFLFLGDSYGDGFLLRCVFVCAMLFELGDDDVEFFIFWIFSAVTEAELFFVHFFVDTLLYFYAMRFFLNFNSMFTLALLVDGEAAAL